MRRPMSPALVTLTVNRADGRGTRVTRVLPWDQAWDWAAGWQARAQAGGWLTMTRGAAMGMVPATPRGATAPLVVLVDVQPLPAPVDEAMG